MTEVKTFIPLPIYDYRVYLIFTENVYKTSINLKKIGFEVLGVDEVTGAFHFKVPNSGDSYVVFQLNANINQITHEIYHAVCAIMKWIGASYEEEIVAYHLGYLVQETLKDQLKALKKHTNLLTTEQK